MYISTIDSRSTKTQPSMSNPTNGMAPRPNLQDLMRLIPAELQNASGEEKMAYLKTLVTRNVSGSRDSNMKNRTHECVTLWLITAECQPSCWLPADATISETPTSAQFCWTGGSQCEQRAGHAWDERWSCKSDTESSRRSRNSASSRAYTTLMCSSRNHRPAFPHAHSATAASIRCQPGCHHASE